MLSDDCGVEVLHYYKVDGVYEPPVCVNVEFDNPSNPNELALISDRAADFDFVELRVRNYEGPGTYAFDDTDGGAANVSVVDQASFPNGFGWPQGELTIDESVESYGTAYSGTYDLTVIERIVDPVTLVISQGVVQIPWTGRFLVVGRMSIVVEPDLRRVMTNQSRHPHNVIAISYNQEADMCRRSWNRIL